MQRVVPILAGAGFTAAISTAAGLILIRRLRLAFDRTEEILFGFVAGSAIVSTIVFLLCCIHQARLPVFLGIGVALFGAVLRSKPLEFRLKQSFSPQKWLYLTLILALLSVYLAVALMPEVSPDGSGYHLGNVTRMYESRGFAWDYHSIYSHLSQGIEMLYLVAFSIGGMSAAATLHLLFLCALALLIACFGRRFGIPRVGMFAAVLVFGSPVVGLVGSSAYVDVALATCVFAVFYLLEAQHEDYASNRLVLLGIIAGFCFAIKYPGGLAVLFALVALRGKESRRLLISAALLSVPWLIRNWFWVGNPLAPFFNRWFPNPFYSAESEAAYVRGLRDAAHFYHWWQIPLDVTIYGAKLPGLIGPIFLLSPFVLLAMRYPLGRRVVAAAAFFAIPAFLNPGVRFLIPALPFVALAMGVAMQNSPGALPATAIFHTILGSPLVMSSYCADWAWRITEVPWRTSREAYITRHLPDIDWLKSKLEANSSKQQKIFALAGLPEAYIDRRVTISYESEQGIRLTRALSHPQAASEFKQAEYAVLVLNYPLNSPGITLIGERNATRIYRVD